MSGSGSVGGPLSHYYKRVSSNQIPAKKKYLVKGQANFRPPLERSKSAPRLTSIDELQEDELLRDHEDEDDEDTDDVGADVSLGDEAEEQGMSEDSDSLKILLLNRILLLHLEDDHTPERELSAPKAAYINA